MGGDRPSGLKHGQKEMLFPVFSGLATYGLHIWPRKDHMMTALANLNGNMMGTIHMNMEGR